MSQQLYFSVLRTAAPVTIARMEIKDNILEVSYESTAGKGRKKSLTLTKDPTENLELLLAFAKEL